MTQHELLNQLEADLRETLDIVRNQILILPPDVLKKRPSDPRRWTILECFEHLNRSANDYINPIELAIHKSKARRKIARPDENVQFTLLGKEAIRWVTSPPSKRFKTSKRYNPLVKGAVSDASVKAFTINAEKILRIIQMSRDVDINRTKVPFAVFKLFTYKLGNLLQFLVAHNKRHTQQALKLIAEFDNQ